MNNNQPDPKKKDLYSEQLLYIIHTEKQALVLKRIGESLIELWKSFITYEK